MRQPSIRRRLMIWVLGALSLGAPLLVFAAYLLTLAEIDEVLDDSLRQTALLLADRDLARTLPAEPAAGSASPLDTESMLVAIARRPDGALLFSSQPATSLSFSVTPGASMQRANDAMWHVFTVVQDDRIVQVAQPASVRRESAAEAASQLLLPLFALVAMIGVLLVIALRRGLQPLRTTGAALADRSASSLAPLDLHDVPLEFQPLVRALNDLLQRLSTAFEAQRNFVADAAHELRSPVTALQLQVQILERSRDPVEQAEITRALAAGIGRTRRLIEQLLYLSGAVADEPAGVPPVRERVGLGDLARAVVVRWSLDAERRQIDLGADVVNEATVVGDAAQLDVLLSNLVDNALRHARRTGVVDIVAGTFEGAPTLRVIDDGPGIPEAERARVFDRFYRSPEAAARAETGSGLGLAIAKAIAGRHRASISLHGGPDGVGLEVRVVFPAPA
jgi:two-component system, OmpR family, sensor kinase